MMEPKTATFFDLVREVMPRVEARMRAGAGDHHPTLNAAIEHLLSGGGKRIRPTLVLLVGGMVGADQKRAITLAAAVEMLHTATLVHDDLIDQSTMRRGIPTINARMTPGATVLTGDYIFARAADLAAQTGSLSVMEGFAQTLMTIVNGEIQQLFGEYSTSSRDDYYDRIYAKTASLFELAAQGPGLLAEIDPAQTESLRKFGYCLGVAFQIVDDILDFVGEQAEVGKPVASDLRHGLITLPTLYYMEREPADETLKALLAGANPDDIDFERLVEDIRASGAVDGAKEEARQVMADGLAHLDATPESAEQDALRDLSHYVVQRTL